MKSLEDSGLLMKATATLKYVKNKQEGGLFGVKMAAMTALMIAPTASPLI